MRTPKDDVIEDDEVEFQLNFQTVLESTDRKKELHVIGVEEYTDVIKNLRYSVDKPDEAKWSQMNSL
jgi:hypothetical protein